MNSEDLIEEILETTGKVLEEVQLATLYAEFADEDRELAEAGMSDYAERLMKEDNQ